MGKLYLTGNSLLINGLTQRGVYAAIDSLDITLNGNQLERVDDKAEPVLRSGSFDFYDDKVRTDGAEYEYDGNGVLTMDANRGITKIEYGLGNNPTLIQFSDGSRTEYVYTATGEKLRTIHYTAAPDITVPYGQTHELVAGEILYADSTDYVGNLILSNFHFFNYDHLGNVREVVGDDGTLEQVNNYYPFGAPFTDNATSAKNPDLQPYKYTGKELDLTHGLKTYDHGARQNYSVLGVWDRIDPLCEKYYNVSPYVVCGDNPINKIDPNGLTDYYLYSNGLIKHGVYDNSRTDRLLLHNSDKYINISTGILKQLLNQRNGFKGHYATIRNRNDAFKLFKFVADNSDVEWSLKSYREGESEAFRLTTSNKCEEVNDISSDKNSNLNFDLHSHPRKNGRDRASGNYEETKGIRYFNSNYLTGDLKVVISTLGTLQLQNSNYWPKFYIYNSRTKSAFQYNWHNSQFNKQRINNYYQLEYYIR